MSHVEEKLEQDIHGASDSARCPADSLTTVTLSHVEEKLEEDRHGASDSACCPADSLTTVTVGTRITNSLVHCFPSCPEKSQTSLSQQVLRKSFNAQISTTY